MNPPRRKGSLGCFGVLCIFFLLLLTGLNYFVLNKLNPHWYDRWALWKGPLLEPDPVVEVDLQSARFSPQYINQQQQNADAYVQAKPAPAPNHYKLKQAAQPSVNQWVTPDRPSTLDGGDGCRLDIPAGGVSATVAASLTPITEVPESMSAEFMGPVFSVALGPQAHYQFAQPVTITLGYDPVAARNEPVTLAFWNKDHWEQVPSTVDPKTRSISARVTHASIWTTVRAVAWPVARQFGPQALMAYIIYNIDSAGRGLDWAMKQVDMKCHRTQNFCVYYFDNGDDNPQPPSDIKYHALNGRTPAFVSSKTIRRINESVMRDDRAVPLYVLDVADHSEFALKTIQKAGLNLSSVGMINSRYNVFILDAGGLGTSKVGGPVMISNTMDGDFKSCNMDVMAAMRGIVTHELLHVAQMNYFGYWKPVMKDSYRPMVEATAQYLSDRICADESRAANVTRDYYLNDSKARLCSISFDKMDDNHYYAFARFFDWIDTNHGGVGKDIAIDVLESGSPTLEQLALSVKKVFQAKRSQPMELSELYRKFAIEFYVTGAHTGTLAPHVHGDTPVRQMQVQTNAAIYPSPGEMNGQEPKPAVWDPGFALISSRPEADAKGGSVAIDIWAQVYVPMFGHFTSNAFYVHVPSVLKSRKPKVVFELTVPGDQSFSAATADGFVGKFGAAKLPDGAAAETAESFKGEGQRLTAVLAFGDKDLNRASLLVHNPSLTKDIKRVTVARYLLMAPAWCSFVRDGEPNAALARKWTITWHKAELEPFTNVFGGYNVYRKVLGEPDTALQCIAEGVAGNVHTDTAPDEQNYVYTVKLRDRLGNISEPAPISGDPFIGKWSGEIQLVKGSLIQDLINQTEKSAAELDAREQAKINQMEAGKQAAARQEWQQQKDAAAGFFNPIKQMLLNAEGILRLGVPVEFQIRGQNGQYRLMLTEVAYKATGMTVQHELTMVRMGRDTLRFKVEANSKDDEGWEALRELGLNPPELVLTRSPPTAGQSSMRNSAGPGANYVVPTLADGKFRGAELKWWFDRTDDAAPPPVLKATEGFMLEFEDAVKEKVRSK